MKTLPMLLAAALAGAVVSATPHGAGGRPLNLHIGTQGDQLAFDRPKLEAKAGQSVQLTFKNNAGSLQHAWFLLKPGTETQVAQAASGAGPDKGYYPGTPEILAHTRLLKGGESQTIRFKAPSAPGEYPYICPFPGHSAVMKGVLEVK